MCVCMCVIVCHCVPGKSGGNLWKAVLSFQHRGPRNQSQLSATLINTGHKSFVHSFIHSLIMGQSLTLWPMMFSKVQSACLSFHRFRIKLLSPTGNLLKRHPLTFLFSSPHNSIPQNNFLCSLRRDLIV